MDILQQDLRNNEYESNLYVGPFDILLKIAVITTLILRGSPYEIERSSALTASGCG